MTVLTGDQFARADEAGRLIELGPRGTPEPDDDAEPARRFTVESVTYDESDSLVTMSPVVGLAGGDFLLRVDAQGELVTDQPEHFYAVVDGVDELVRLRPAVASYAAESDDDDAPPAGDGTTPPPD